MKKKGLIVIAVLFALILTTTVVFATPIPPDKEKCTTIQSGNIYTTDNETINVGYSQWGYNYQAHMFNGDWCDYHPNYRPGGGGYEWCQENMANVELMMKWNQDWLANVDRDDNGLLDRHYGFPTYRGSGAWLTNHERGTYLGDIGQTCSYEYFVKIVATPADAYVSGDYWYTADGIEIGEEIWGAFAIIQTVNNDPCGGAHGLEYLSDYNPGLGNW